MIHSRKASVAPPAPTHTQALDKASHEASIDDWRIAFGEVRHCRLRPRKHALRAAAYTLLGDVTLLGRQPLGNWLIGINRPALIAFRSADHGDGRAPMDWVSEMLADAGLPPPATLHFQGFPRVLGHAFKPVSFWFCANSDGRRYAVIAEVNNTFGERHCYLLANADASPLRNGERLTACKAFHVSPFCSVDGQYSFRFLTRNERQVARIDLDDDDGPLLVTSLSAQAHRIALTTSLRALLGYPFFSLMVVARIHWHALRLWAKRVPWFAKPSPPERIVTLGMVTPQSRRKSV